MITENVSTLQIHKFQSEEQYLKAVADGLVDEYSLCLTPDEELDLSDYATKEELNEAIGSISECESSDIEALFTT